MLEFLFGFVSCLIIWILCHFGIVQPRIKALESKIEGMLGMSKNA